MDGLLNRMSQVIEIRDIFFVNNISRISRDAFEVDKTVIFGYIFRAVYRVLISR